MPQYTISLDDSHIGQRLDSALSNALPTHSRAQIQGWIKEGHVTAANGQSFSNPSFKLKAPCDITIDAPEPPSLDLTPDASLHLPIIYEDDALLVINKPTGLAVHPGAGHMQGTLVNALLAHTKGQLSEGSEMGRPGIVHRLDKDTSGAMIVAKTNQAHYLLSKALGERTIKRHYWALVWGMPNPLHDTVDTQIGRDTRNRQKMTVLKTGGKQAITHYNTQKIYRLSNEVTISLVLCVLDTGRTHQIRVHMSHVGHAVLCDPAYGERPMSKYRRKLPQELQDLLTALPGQALHARELDFDHPLTGEPMSFTADLPEPLQRVIDYLDEHYS